MSFSVSMDGSVCSLIRFNGFGEKTPWGYGKTGGYVENSAFVDLATLMKTMSKTIDYYNDQCSTSSNHFKNCGLVMAVLITEQPKAIGYLREIGGWTEIPSVEMKKYHHEVIVFIQPIKDFIANYNIKAEALKIEALAV